MRKHNNQLFLIIPVAILSILSIFLFSAYKIKILDGQLVIQSKILGELKSTLIGKDSPKLKLSNFTNKQLPSSSDLTTPSFKLVNFWASWCAPCRAEHKNLVLINRLGYKIIGVNYKDNPLNAEKFLNNLGNPYHKIGSDKNGESAISWGVYGIPETFLIDSDNKIVLKIAGPITQSVYKNRLKEFLDP